MEWKELDCENERMKKKQREKNRERDREKKDEREKTLSQSHFVQIASFSSLKCLFSILPPSLFLSFIHS